MTDPIKDLAELDQAAAVLSDCLPQFWRRLYEGCVAAGFDPPDAFQLLRTYITSQAACGNDNG